MPIDSFIYALHVLAALIWVGGMFFAWLILRPAAVSALTGPARLTLWLEVFRRFFSMGMVGRTAAAHQRCGHARLTLRRFCCSTAIRADNDGLVSGHAGTVLTRAIAAIATAAPSSQPRRLVSRRRRAGQNSPLSWP
jgi:hypothetical protein